MNKYRPYILSRAGYIKMPDLYTRVDGKDAL